MTDSHSDILPSDKERYELGRDLYGASVEEMRGWVISLEREMLRVHAEIEKKQRGKAAADSIFKKP